MTLSPQDYDAVLFDLDGTLIDSFDPIAAIMNHVRSLHGTFTMADIHSSVGGSPMTVRKGVQALVDDGTIIRLGPMRSWTGRGRAPIVFEVR